MHPLLIAGILGVGGGFAWKDKKRSDRVADRRRIQSEHQGSFYNGITEAAENLWVYEQDDGTTVEVLEAPPFEAHHQEFQQWYADSPLRGRVHAKWLAEQIGQPASWRTVFFLLPNGAVYGAELDPDNSGGFYTVREGAIHPMFAGEDSRSLCEPCNENRTLEDDGAWHCVSCGSVDTETDSPVVFDQELGAGFVGSIPCRDPGEAPRSKWLPL